MQRWRITIDSGPVVVDATSEIFGEVPNVAGAGTGGAGRYCYHCTGPRWSTPYGIAHRTG
jgi:hypothetical protein